MSFPVEFNSMVLIRELAGDAPVLETYNHQRWPECPDTLLANVKTDQKIAKFFRADSIGQQIHSILGYSSTVPKQFPFLFDDYSNLRPWKGAAEILAKDNDWAALYDLYQLAKNEVPVSAVSEDPGDVMKKFFKLVEYSWSIESSWSLPNKWRCLPSLSSC